LARVDELLDHAKVHLGVVLGERIVEATLRNSHVQRHLAAFEAIDAHARTGLGALLAAAGGLALARTDTTAHTHAAFPGAGIIPQIIEFHDVALAFALIRAEKEVTPVKPDATEINREPPP